jgi:putative DNA primase/helicase
MRPDDLPHLHAVADAVVNEHRKARKKRINGTDIAAETAGYDLGQTADGRPAIDCTPGRRAPVVDACMAIFGEHPAVYARGGSLVRVARADRLERPDRLRTDDARLLIAPCPPEWIGTELARRARFERWDRRARKRIACDPPAWAAPAMLADGQFDGIRPLRGITCSPVLRPDGSVWTTPGYDDATGMLLASRGELPTIPDAPTKADALAALERLRVLFSGYAWADEYGESVALSLILTKPARHLMPTAPLHLITSPTAGSGKTQIIESGSIIADGLAPSVCGWAGDDEEMRKSISAALHAGESFICFDNIANGRVLRSAALDRVLTAPIVADRMLGTMDRLTLVNGAVWSATGNNVTPCADMVRRVIVARIDPRSERPWDRAFDWTPAEYARANRAELLGAALTILAAHLRTNRKPLARPLASFEEWSRIVRDALLWLGLPDAVKSQDQIADEDPDAEERADLLTALKDHFGSEPFTADDVAKVARDAGMASEVSAVGRLAAVIRARLADKPASAVRVGHVLRAVKDQVSGRIALRGKLDKHRGAILWQIARIGGDCGDCGDRFGAAGQNCQQMN